MEDIFQFTYRSAYQCFDKLCGDTDCNRAIVVEVCTNLLKVCEEDRAYKLLYSAEAYRFTAPNLNNLLFKENVPNIWEDLPLNPLWTNPLWNVGFSVV